MPSHAPRKDAHDDKWRPPETSLKMAAMIMNAGQPPTQTKHMATPLQQAPPWPSQTTNTAARRTRRLGPGRRNSASRHPTKPVSPPHTGCYNTPQPQQVLLRSVARSLGAAAPRPPVGGAGGHQNSHASKRAGTAIRTCAVQKGLRGLRLRRALPRGAPK